MSVFENLLSASRACVDFRDPTAVFRLIHVQARRFNLSPKLKTYIESKISLMLSRHQSKISRVEGVVDDINGPRGGEDQRCKLIIRPINTPSIVVEQTEVDIYGAVNLCLHRAKRSLKRKLNFMSAHQRNLNASY